MEPLFAPWRFTYVTSADKTVDGECIFCRALASDDDASTLTLWRGETCFALLNRYPYTSGHAMVAPREHVADLDALGEAELAEIMLTGRNLIRALRRVYGPHGFNVGFNLGEAAGAGIEEHLHLHVVPRWRADTNFISVVGDVRIIPEDLETTWRKVRGALLEIVGEEVDHGGA